MQSDESTFSDFPRSLGFAIGAMIVLVVAAVIGGHLTANWGLFSLRPPATDAVPSPVPDVMPENAFQLHQTVFTAWAALVLLYPVYMNFWLRQKSEVANKRWKIFWKVSWVAFLIHLYWAIVIFFDGDLGQITSSPRVSAFWPGILVAAWWGFDVILSWTTHEGRQWVRWQRVFIHLVVAIFFIIASIFEGEVLISKALGVALVLAIISGVFRRFSSKKPS